VTRRRRALRLSLAAVALAALSACGKKGPPLAPIRRAPAQITDLAARRAGDVVRLTFTAPMKSDDESELIDLARVDVYALTVAKPAEAPEGAAFLTKATIVATVEKPKPAEPATLEEKITTDAASPVRIYVAVPTDGRRRRGLPSARAIVSLAGAPATPGGLRAQYDAEGITLDWLPATPAPDGYVVYEVKQGAAAPKPLNEKPLQTTTFVDAREMPFGLERCYIVRASAAAVGGSAIESDSSAPACVTPRDTFPPAAPAGLAAVAGPGAISLIWDANTEADLAGYHVLRGEAPGEKLQALTPAPIRETMYRDDTVQPGVRYVYVIVAVDGATPPNVSPQSARVEEIAR
jgi:hypothetical protein